MKTAPKLLASFLLLTLLSGCATSALWSNSEDFNEPAPDAKLQVYRAPGKYDFLVMYDECLGRKGTVRRQAYFLLQNEERKKGHVHFVSTKTAEALSPIHVFAKTPAQPRPEFYVVAQTNSTSFELCASNGVLGNFRLPVYNDGKGKFERIAWTPLTVAADVTMVGGAMAVVAACQDGMSFAFP